MGGTAGSYWRDGQELPKPVVDLRGARCPRCPRGIRAVPAEKVRVTAYPSGRYIRTFVCPHCRDRTSSRVGSVEATRLVAAGAGLAHVAAPMGPLTEDDLIAFGRRAAAVSDLARLALEA